MSLHLDLGKKERSPSYPFIPLTKAVDRATAFWEKHRREAARLATVAPTWGYREKSSGLQQTVGALKQYGLMEDSGSGEDRKVQLTDLARRIISDQREGAREAAIRESAMKPRLFQEYARWIDDPPSEAHCLSELELDRGFNPEAAKAFYRAFEQTVSFAGLRGPDRQHNESPEEVASEPDEARPADTGRKFVQDRQNPAPVSESFPSAELASPLSGRLKLEITVGALRVSAILVEVSEVDALIRLLEANKALLGEI